MRPGEYVLTLLAIISGLAASHLATSLHRLLVAGRRVRWDWLAATVALLVAYQLVLSWWTAWLNLKDQVPGATPLWAFLIRLGQLVCVFLSARTALPESVPEGGIDMRIYYAEHSRLLWTIQVVLQGLIIVAVPVHVQVEHRPPPVGAATAGLAVSTAVCLLLAFVRRRAIHAVAAPLALAALVASSLRLAI